MDEEYLQKILSRPEKPLDIQQDLAMILSQGSRILITGAAGSIGVKICEIFRDSGINYLNTDISECDVRDKSNCKEVVSDYSPTHILHLAADKHAPAGEIHIEETLDINALGTRNIIEAASISGAKVVLASTCKSCDPETVYGATKLIAERMVLNSSGSVARFYNVIDTAGNVFEIWSKCESDAEIQVTNCYRFFITSNEAASLLVKTLAISNIRPGRYIYDPGTPHYMPDIAKRIYPDRKLLIIPPRRGDRLREPLKAENENLIRRGTDFIEVVSAHDNANSES